jgi:hypothetical protein
VEIQRERLGRPLLIKVVPLLSEVAYRVFGFELTGERGVVEDLS